MWLQYARSLRCGRPRGIDEEGSHAIVVLRVLISIFLSGAAGSAFCQTVPPAASVPDNILYSAFFTRMMWLDDIGRQIDAQGHDGSSARAQIRGEAGLNAGEEAALRSVATRWKQQNDAILAPIMEVQKRGAQPDRQLVDQVTTQRRKSALDRIAELKALFGPERFARLDAYVRATSTVRPPGSIQDSGAAK
jgi:hypothetical protein